ncbi:MAG TPA: DnaJ C-terminal domain-containing protein [Pseudonocardiaceae bacterium]|jgi:curved DNA-binding protein
MARDYYDALGVSRNADTGEIQRQYRKLARQYHPDVNKDPGAEERFKEVSEAYSVLADPDTRRRYDRFGPDFRQIPEDYEAYADTAGVGGRRSRAGGRGARRGARAGSAAGGGSPFGGSGVWVDSGGGPADVGIDFEDLFGSMFGSRGRGGPLQGADQEAELELTVEEAYRGGRRHVTLSGPGQQVDLEVTIPPGVTEGQRIRLAGEGGQGTQGSERGDLYLVVRIARHPRYRVEGRDISVDLPLAPWEAALGATVSVTTPGGEAKVRVPPGSSTGRRLRLRGEGMPNPRGTAGDLYAEVKIMVPRKLTERERELFEQLGRESTFDPRK